MSRTPDPQRRVGLSRREFVQGRFLRAFGQGRGKAIPNDAIPSVDNPNGRQRVSLVMRYPRTLTEVAAGDADQDSAATISSTPSAMARRRTIPVMRPPGAIEELDFLAGCTRCNDCAKACPHDAILPAPERFREAAGTPMIDADHQACLMCADYPCIAACDEDVLSSLIAPMLGTARVTEQLCVAHHGTTCTVCSEHCPVEGAIDVTNGKPTINEASCTGCGVCRYVCVAPENAILLMPAFVRSSPQEKQKHDQ
jgi:ferredoxin-type protein NapG